MAKPRIPNALDRRHLIENELGEAQALQVADAYLEQGRTVEAVDFLAKASAGERLTELRSEAVGSGDVFLLRSAARAMGETPSHAEWSRIAETAEAGGRELQAADARRQLQRGKGGESD